MMSRTTIILTTLLCLVTVPVVTLATGFGRNEQGARAMGVAGAGVTAHEDPSAIYYNPAGLGWLDDGTHLYGGVSFLYARMVHSGTAPYPGYDRRESWENNILTPVHAYVTIPIMKRVVAGVGYYTPYRWRSEWRLPDFFSGRYLALDTDIQGSYLTPSLSIRLLPFFSVGAGASAVSVKARVVRREPYQTFSGSVATTIDLAEATFEGTSQYDAASELGYTFNAGAQLDMGFLRLGASYRQGVTNEIDGTASYRFLSTGDEDVDEDLVSEVPEDRDVRIQVTLPTEGTLGASLRLSSKWRLEADAVWTLWSEFSSIEIGEDEDSLAIVPTQTYEDGLGVRAGLTFTPHEKLALRFGYAFDDAVAPTTSLGPMFTDAVRQGISGGFSYTYEAWRVDLFQMLSFFDQREVRDSDDGWNGNHGRTEWTSGVSVGYTIW
jgi:long-chain fatty acid transport protein